jgi:hypothetical protein
MRRRRCWDGRRPKKSLQQGLEVASRVRKPKPNIENHRREYSTRARSPSDKAVFFAEAMKEAPVPDLIKSLASRLGMPAFVAVCTGLMSGADRNDYVDELRGLTGHAWNPGDNVFDSQSWPDYWVRTWGARGLLHVWHDSATGAVVAGLSDEHWRPVEMCLKVSARHEVAGTGDGAATLVTHELPRVRIQALRALAVVGDTPHIPLVEIATNDPRPEVQRQALKTLDQMSRRLDFPLPSSGSV